MIPYVALTSFHLGPLTIQVWGLLVALGIAAAVSLFSARVKRRGGDPNRVWELAVPILVAAFIGSRLAHVLLYDFGFYRSNPSEILKIWHGGMSSLGGFFGAIIGLWYALRRYKMSWAEFVAKYLDDGMLSFWLGWGIGRIGCFLIHDHPGTLTSFIGGVRYPDGVRHDLGLYESVLGFGLFFFCLALYPRLNPRHKGLLAGVSIVIYAVIRFGLDFLRTVDSRWGGLTPAQWGMGLIITTLTFSCIFGKKLQSLRTEPSP